MTHAVRLSETLNDNQRFSAAVAGNNSYLLILILTMLTRLEEVGLGGLEPMYVISCTTNEVPSVYQ